VHFVVFGRGGGGTTAKVRREMETTEVDHGIDHIPGEWPGVHPSNRVSAKTAIEREAIFVQIYVGACVEFHNRSIFQRAWCQPVDRPSPQPFPQCLEIMSAMCSKDLRT
jgi:hypothetical protein